MTRIFVFGSNEAGRHGKGAALYALQHHGAVYGQPRGLQGNSYAIPTKDHDLRVLKLSLIKVYVDTFVQFAKDHPELEFDLTPIGCGLAGYSREQIRPMFKDISENVHFLKEWEDETR